MDVPNNALFNKKRKSLFIKNLHLNKCMLHII